MTLDTLLTACLPAIETEIQACLHYGSAPSDAYHEMLYYHMGWADGGQGGATTAGKRMRPALALLTCGAVGGNWRAALPAAAAVELFHNFTLIHDDIQDGSPTRRGRPTVWKLWGVPQAINAGDALFAYARQALGRLSGQLAPERVLTAIGIFDATSLRVTRGQFLDMDFEKRSTASVGEYMEMIEGKTAALIAASAELGALCGGAAVERRALYREFGRHLGLAFQAQDDLLGVWGDAAATGKSASTDIETRKKTLPVVYGLERSAALRKLYAAETPSETPGEIVAVLEQIGAREFVEAEVQRLSARALDYLAEARAVDEYAESLRELTERLAGRHT